jgi:predicted transcriptional regulator of viral defense system
MTLLDALSTIESMDAAVFCTSDAAARLRVPNGHASVVLARLAASGHMIRLRRGVWALPGRVDPLALPEYLTAPFPAYVSLQSALYLHGMISQMPAVTYAVSLARTRRFTTPFGTVSVHHVKPAFFFGFQDAASRSGVRLATPEKALVDFLYLTPARSRLFRALPELEWPKRFSVRAARSIVKGIEPVRRRTLASRALDRLIREKSEL